MDLLLMESLAKSLDYQNPVGPKRSEMAKLNGVKSLAMVKDFTSVLLPRSIEPILLFTSKNYLNRISIKISRNNIPATLKFLESKWAAYNPNTSLFHMIFWIKPCTILY